MHTNDSQDNNSKAKLSRLKNWLRIITSLSLLSFIIVSVDFDQLVSIFKNIDTKFIVIILVFDIFMRLFVSYRWYVLLHRTHPDFGFGEATRTTFIANFIGQFLPSWVGIEALRIYGMAKKTSDLAGSFTSVFIDRVLGVLSLLISVCIGLVFAPEGIHSNIKIAVWIFFVFLLIGLTIIFHPFPRKTIEMLMPARLKSLTQDKLKKLYVSIDEYKKYPWTLFWALLLAIIFQFFRIVLAYLAALALGVHPPVLDFFALFPIILFMMLLPISVAGIGVRDFSLIYFFSTFGIMDEASAFSVSIIIFVSMIFCSLPGAYFYITTRSTK